MFLIKNNRAFYIVVAFFLITYYLFSSNVAMAGDWECQGISGNMDVLKINSDPEGLMTGALVDPSPEGNEGCDTEVRSTTTDDKGKLAYVLQPTDGLMLMSFSLDLSGSVINEGAEVEFAQLESGSGYDQAQLLGLRLTRNNDDLLLLVDWFQLSSSGFGVTLVQTDALNVNDYMVNDQVSIAFEWDNGLTSVSVVNSAIVSTLSDSSSLSPEIFQVGLIEQIGMSTYGLIYTIYDIEANVIN